MKIKTLLTVTTFALVGWFAVASASTLQGPALPGGRVLPGYQVAQMAQGEPEERQEHHPEAHAAAHHHGKHHPEARVVTTEHQNQIEQRVEHHGRAPRVLADQWYQGQRGHWYRENNNWQWRGAQGDQWYQGQRGHWYQEPNGMRFGSAGLVCNNQGFNCRVGGYLPANGEGMVSRDHPGLFWHCDSEGHNCNWARRPF